ncbi:unnamed protein product [Vitrella brassicaformis CCMP3155]|uniref:RING-type domain-containing protein n=1 Tax=Vitrella brassicaformis (strain CCMP3155) TaxID=1169540 RepID=A0A0G4EMV1_VITBC|nr:unnamed protein product [Vitrella brassicaformis CCMP3155]|eukprot:CEL98342.1 unnamed protein product [Vitrella brassicaformis CCMP3155]
MARGGGDEQHLSCEICTNAYTSTGLRTPQVLRCGHSYCADCVRDLQRRAANNTISCPNRCGVMTPADVDVPKCYPLVAAVEAKEQQDRDRMAVLLKCSTAAYSLTRAETQVVIETCQLANEVDMEAPLSAIRSRLHTLMMTSIEGSMMNRMQGVFLTKWVGGTGKSLRSLYRATRDGPSYGDLLRCVGDTKDLVFVVSKGEYVFGAFVSGGLQLPDDPTGVNEYDCDGWQFSLAGHFTKGPTKL